DCALAAHHCPLRGPARRRHRDRPPARGRPDGGRFGRAHLRGDPLGLGAGRRDSQRPLGTELGPRADLHPRRPGRA
ncbi:MAG: hypothetical protein AVDCRST_MAG18-1939, partial [uncultured Thermomicrobiales bacterium]